MRFLVSNFGEILFKINQWRDFLLEGFVSARISRIRSIVTFHLCHLGTISITKVELIELFIKNNSTQSVKAWILRLLNFRACFIL